MYPYRVLPPPPPTPPFSLSLSEPRVDKQALRRYERGRGKKKERGGERLRERDVYRCITRARWKRRSERGGRKERERERRTRSLERSRSFAKAKEPKAKGRSVVHVACTTTTTATLYDYGRAERLLEAEEAPL